MRYDQVADDVFRIQGTEVAMVLARDGDALTLIDAGWLGDAAVIEESVRALGHRPEDITAVLLSHAHLDHIGALAYLHTRYGTPAYTAPAEVGHARGEYHETATALDVISRAWKPRTAAWAVRIARAGGLRENIAPHIQPFPVEGALDLPGSPIPIATPGHTSGHSGFHLPVAGVLATGDALVTAHPTAPTSGPQLLPDFFNHSTSRAVDGLAAFESVDADVVVPGHGAVWTGGVRRAVELAREHAAAH
ncbi:MBL fold metallo-hydrolase [Nocardia bovistercoris]|uniref:MBL fold metallo-hydrolase n=1 Tax=Nocardia bovistercoris TaxID=2785916 RepID=A0A931N6N9_9NOCA|nr:MBL fold metallo-hydrolase [Nocardia bovistercoris]MBH0781159.1 MBL fold metallo-hydrolase [Nocardia bovistercoris]